MKTSYKFFAILSLLILLSSCDPEESYGINGIRIYLRAAINETCKTTINYNVQDIYRYHLSDEIIGSYWQMGGHPSNASNEIPDLGLNIVVEDLESKLYEVTDHFVLGKAFIYYIDENGYEFYSTANNSGSVIVNIIPGSTSRIEIRFNNVEVFNETLEETKCINNFSYSNAI